MERKFELDYEIVVSEAPNLGLSESTLNWHLRNGIHGAMWDGKSLMLSPEKPEELWALNFLIEHGMIFFLNDRYYTTPYGWFAYEQMNVKFCECYSELRSYIKKKRIRRFFTHPLDSLLRTFGFRKELMDEH